MRCLIACLTFLSSITAAYADDSDKDCEKDPRACFEGFEDDGSVIPKNEKVERTFSVPPVKAGFLIDFYHPDILPHLAIEILDFKIPKAGDFVVDTGVTVSRVFVALTWEFIPIVKAGPTIWAGYHVKEQDPAFGIGVSILDF